MERLRYEVQEKVTNASWRERALASPILIALLACYVAYGMFTFPVHNKSRQDHSSVLDAACERLVDRLMQMEPSIAEENAESIALIAAALSDFQAWGVEARLPKDEPAKADAGFIINMLTGIGDPRATFSPRGAFAVYLVAGCLFTYLTIAVTAISLHSILDVSFETPAEYAPKGLKRKEPVSAIGEGANDDAVAGLSYVARESVTPSLMYLFAFGVYLGVMAVVVAVTTSLTFMEAVTQLYMAMTSLDPLIGDDNLIIGPMIVCIVLFGQLLFYISVARIVSSFYKYFCIYFDEYKGMRPLNVTKMGEDKN